MTEPVNGKDKVVESGDPLELVGVSYRVESAEDDDRAMARCFIEEYALVGWDAARIRNLFLSPMYSGPHGITCRRGIAFVDTVIAEVFGPQGAR